MLGIKLGTFLMIPHSKIVIDTRRLLKDGSRPLMLRINHKRIPVYLNLEYAILTEHWDADSQSINANCKKYKNLARINNTLLKKRLEIDELLEYFDRIGELRKLSPTQLKRKLEKKEQHISFKSFTEQLISEFKEAHKLGNASVYEQAWGFLKRYTEKDDLTFEDITYSLLKSLESKHMAKDNSKNGLSFYLRTIRAIYNRAIKAGIVKKELYPFENYSIKETKTVKRAIKKKDISTIKNAALEKDSKMWQARNFFLFSFYNRGMNFADIAQLKVSNIVNGRINYKRAKTGKNYTIKLTSEASSILAFYLKESMTPDDFIFPIIKRVSLEDQRKDEENERKLYNNALKDLAAKCEIKAHLTGGVARHTWATVAKENNVPLSVISEGLGHEDSKTTQIYLDSFDDDIIDAANQLIIS